MKITKWLKREKIGPFFLAVGDSIALLWNNTEIMRSAEFEYSGTVDEAGCFECEMDGKVGIGGVFFLADGKILPAEVAKR